MAMEGLEKLKKKERELCMDEMPISKNSLFCGKPKGHFSPEHAEKDYFGEYERQAVIKWIWEED